jgi:hypothetical protein
MQWYLSDGELWLSLGKIERGYLLRFNKLADFFVGDCGEEIICMPKLGIPPETIHHLLLDQVIPLIINLKGGEALHVSAILIPQGVVAFAGPTGSGKSTLAGSFINIEYPILSDDCLALMEKDRGIYAVPAYPGLRLWGDALSYLFGNNGDHKKVAHYTTKQRVSIERTPRAYCAENKPLVVVYIVVDPSETEGKMDIMIERLRHRDRFMELIKYAFRLDITDRTMLERQFRFLERVSSCVSVRRLIFPRDFNLLPAVREAILADLQDLDN